MAGKKKKKKSYLGIFLSTLFKVLLIILLLGMITAGVLGLWFYNKYYKSYDKDAKETVENGSREDFRRSEPSAVYDSKGNLIIKLRSEGDSSYLKYEDIPDDAVNAFIAVEDRTFWNNPGYDIKGIARVLVYYIKTRGVEAHGASTITQQLARNAYLSNEVSISRKLKEILIAKYITKKYSKKDIMEFYVNDVYFANQYYGLEAAAEGYFGVKASALTLSQTAYLCSIPNRPAYYDPIKNPDNALKRRNKILGDMLEMGFIDENEYNGAIAEKITIKQNSDNELHDYQATFAVDCAVRYFMAQDGFQFKYTYTDKDDYNNYQSLYDEQYDEEKTRLYTGGYRIFTSLDSTHQDKIQEAVDTELSFDTSVNESTGAFDLQGAVTCIDNDTGKVTAIVGGRTLSGNTVYSLNRAYQSFRQPGSSIKPLIVYAPALENGYAPGSIVQNIDVTAAKVPGTNALSLTGASMPLRTAVEQSKNGCAWQIFANITPAVGLKHITDMCYDEIVPDDYNLAAALGGLTYGATTAEQASGYAALADHGLYRGRTCITSIQDSEGNNVYDDDEPIQAYTSQAADTMVDIMKGVITQGTAASMKWSKSSDIEAAGKTGTTNGSKDGWFCGITPYYSIAVWVGYDNPKELSTLYGSSYPAAIWKDSMLAATDGLDARSFSLPDKMEEYPSGLEKYLPGRDDSEVLYTGYTVGDYRTDRTVGESIAAAEAAMQLLDPSTDPNFNTDLTNYYNQCMAAITTIKDQPYATSELTDLNNVYALCATKTAVPSVTPSDPSQTAQPGNTTVTP